MIGHKSFLQSRPIIAYQTTTLVVSRQRVIGTLRHLAVVFATQSLSWSPRVGLHKTLRSVWDCGYKAAQYVQRLRPQSSALDVFTKPLPFRGASHTYAYTHICKHTWCFLQRFLPPALVRPHNAQHSSSMHTIACKIVAGKQQKFASWPCGHITINIALPAIQYTRRGWLEAPCL